MEPAIFHSIARRRDSRHGTAVLPFSAWQGGAAVWRVGVLKADGSLDDLAGVTAIILRISSYGGTTPGAAAWITQSVPSAAFAMPATADAVRAGAEWHAEVSLSSEQMTLPVEDSGERKYWYEWRAEMGGSEVILSAGIMVLRGVGQDAGSYALSDEVQAESTARQQAITILAEDITGLAGEQAGQEERLASAEAAVSTKAEAAAVSALGARTATLETTQTSNVGRIGALETAVPLKASTDLTNTGSEVVLNRHLAPQSITPDKLTDALRAAMGNGLDATKNKGSWNAATNTPAIPAASGHSGEWYYVATAGAATGNAAGTYAVGDVIYSDGTIWQVRPVPATVIPDSSLPLTKLLGAFTRNNVTVTVAPGVTKKGLFGFFTPKSGDHDQALWFIDEDGKQWPNPAATAEAGLATLTTNVTASLATINGQLSTLTPILTYGNDGGIPQQKVEGWTVTDQKYVTVDGTPRQLAYGITAAGGTKLIYGVTMDGIEVPVRAAVDPGSGSGSGDGSYTAPAVLLLPGTSGGLSILDAAGERLLIDDGRTYTAQQHSSGNRWLVRTDKFRTPPSLCTVNAASGLIQPAETGTIYHIGWNGQSLALGVTSNPIISSSAAYGSNSLMFSAGSQAGSGNIPLSPSALTAFAPLVEVFSSLNNSYESPLSAVANRSIATLETATGTRPTFLQSNHAYGGARMTLIQKGTTPYSNGLIEIQKAYAIATALGRRYEFLAYCLEHGQADENQSTGAGPYETLLRQLRADIDADAKAITGQTRSVHLFTNQDSSWSHYTKTTPGAAIGQWLASVNDPYVVCVCPEYFLPFKGDGVHITNVASYRIGEYYAKAILQTLFGKGKFKPLQPVAVSQSISEVVVEFNNAYALAWDTSIVTAAAAYGFELTGAAITGTPVIDGSLVRIPKSGTATAVAYAYTATLSPPGTATNGGPVTGPRGNLRQSNPDVSLRDNAPLYDWSVHFIKSL
ncbi:MAG: Endo,4-beta-xylanase precursor [Verrucomicrobiales bacterium]|nr:Endo,4-beta-xylanase precursor [Verrucomicrobiales bacterium]